MADPSGQQGEEMFTSGESRQTTAADFTDILSALQQASETTGHMAGQTWVNHAASWTPGPAPPSDPGMLPFVVSQQGAPAQTGSLPLQGDSASFAASPVSMSSYIQQLAQMTQMPDSSGCVPASFHGHAGSTMDAAQFAGLPNFWQMLQQQWFQQQQLSEQQQQLALPQQHNAEQAEVTGPLDSLASHALLEGPRPSETSSDSSEEDSDESEDNTKPTVQAQSSDHKPTPMRSVAKKTKRSRLKACAACYAKKIACNGERPCDRCKRLNRVDRCVERTVEDILAIRHSASVGSRKSKSGAAERPACAVCYRLKIGCDRKRPCGRCRRLGKECHERNDLPTTTPTAKQRKPYKRRRVKGIFQGAAVPDEDAKHTNASDSAVSSGVAHNGLPDDISPPTPAPGTMSSDVGVGHNDVPNYNTGTGFGGTFYHLSGGAHTEPLLNFPGGRMPFADSTMSRPGPLRLGLFDATGGRERAHYHRDPTDGLIRGQEIPSVEVGQTAMEMDWGSHSALLSNKQVSDWINGAELRMPYGVKTRLERLPEPAIPSNMDVFVHQLQQFDLSIDILSYVGKRIRYLERQNPTLFQDPADWRKIWALGQKRFQQVLEMGLTPYAPSGGEHMRIRLQKHVYNSLPMGVAILPLFVSRFQDVWFNDQLPLMLDMSPQMLKDSLTRNTYRMYADSDISTVYHFTKAAIIRRLSHVAWRHNFQMGSGEVRPGFCTRQFVLSDQGVALYLVMFIQLYPKDLSVGSIEVRGGSSPSTLAGSRSARSCNGSPGISIPNKVAVESVRSLSPIVFDGDEAEQAVEQLRKQLMSERLQQQQQQERLRHKQDLIDRRQQRQLRQQQQQHRDLIAQMHQQDLLRQQHQQHGTHHEFEDQNKDELQSTHAQHPQQLAEQNSMPHSSSMTNSASMNAPTRDDRFSRGVVVWARSPPSALSNRRDAEEADEVPDLNLEARQAFPEGSDGDDQEPPIEDMFPPSAFREEEMLNSSHLDYLNAFENVE